MFYALMLQSIHRLIDNSCIRFNISCSYYTYSTVNPEKTLDRNIQHIFQACYWIINFNNFKNQLVEVECGVRSFLPPSPLVY